MIRLLADMLLADFFPLTVLYWATCDGKGLRHESTKILRNLLKKFCDRVTLSAHGKEEIWLLLQRTLCYINMFLRFHK